ncbi:MAG: FMN-binding protein [Victivallaceae bacterium]|nr:FMN-binding protein [Victivallaceae bacterium]
MNLKNTSNPLLLGLILCVVGVAAAGILAWFDGVTAKPKAEAKIRKLEQSLGRVLPENAQVGRSVTVDGVAFYAATVDGAPAGYAASGSTTKGYGGRIEALVGISPDGAVLTVAGGRAAVLVTEQKETPGLGTNVCNRTAVKTLATVFNGSETSGMPANRVLDSFGGISVSDVPLTIVKDGGRIEFVTGATVSSRAMTDLVDNVLTVYRDNRLRIEEATK